MKTLTVITTTYNRDYCLHQVYDSLVRQNCQDFIWLIIDDGSKDKTKELVDSWIAENKIEIEYFYKENGGMHTARNLAYEKVHTEINVIIDSDDWMADGAVEKIIDFWNENKREDVAGIVSLDASPKGEIIGANIPEWLKEAKYGEIWGKYNLKGDKKLVYRSDLTKMYPYPEYEGEKFFPPSYKFYYLDLDYTLLIMNEITCIVDYNDDSMTRDKFAQYKNSPRSFAYYRNEMAKISKSPKFIIQQMVHYVAESKLSGEKHYVKKAHRKGYAIMCWLPGRLLYKYLTKTKRKY